MNTELDTTWVPFRGDSIACLYELRDWAIEKWYKVIKPIREDYHWFDIVEKSERTWRDMIINFWCSWPYGLAVTLTYYPSKNFGSWHSLLYKWLWSHDAIEDAIRNWDMALHNFDAMRNWPHLYKTAEEYLTPDGKYWHIWYEYELFNF